MKDHSISVGQARYANSIVDKYIDTATINTGTKFYNTTFPYDMMLTKDYVSTSDEQVEKLTSEINIHYRACIGSSIYLLSRIVDLSFSVHKSDLFSPNTDKVYF